MRNLWSKLGSYEKRLCILLMLTALTNPLSVFSTLFYHYTPQYRCGFNQVTANYKQVMKELQNNETMKTSINNKSLEEFFRPTEVDSLGQSYLSKCSLYNRTTKELIQFLKGNSGSKENSDKARIVSCNQVDFFFKPGVTSAIGEFNMVCKNSWMKPFVLVVYMIGKCFGSVSSGWFSDRFGRLPCFFLFTAFQFVATFAISFSTSFQMYTALTFFVGIGSLGNYLAALMLGVETTGKEFRNLVVFILAVGFSLGYMITPLVGYLLPNWRSYAFYTALVGLIYIPFYWFLDESPRWLLAVGRENDAAKIFRKIAKFNGRKGLVEDELRCSMIEKTNTRNVVLLKTWVKMIKNGAMLFRILATCLAWMICNVSYYAIAYDTNSLSGNRFLNCFYAALAELASMVSAFFLVEFGGRKNSYSVCMFVAGVAIAFMPLLKLWDETAVVVFTMFNKLIITIAFQVVYVCTGELFPTSARHSVFSTCSGFGRLGGALAPVVIFAGHSGTTFSPYLVTGVFTLVSSILYVFVPNTHNVTLPDDVKDAIRMPASNPLRNLCKRQKSTVATLQ